MSMTVDGVWKSGAWATTVWADGVWYEPGGTPATQQPPVGGGYVDNEYWERVRKEREQALDAIIQREFEKTVVTPTVTTAKAAKKFKRFVYPDAPKVDFKALREATEKNKALLKTYRDLIALINRQMSAEIEAERIRLMMRDEEEYLLLVVALRRRGRLNIH